MAPKNAMRTLSYALSAVAAGRTNCVSPGKNAAPLALSHEGGGSDDRR